jgi:TolA-binding protein
VIPERKLADHIVAEATAGELADQWRAIEARLRPRPRRGMFALAFAVAGAGTALLLVFALGGRTAPVRQVASQAAPMTMALADGSQVDLRPHSDVRVVVERPSEVRLQVVRGGAHFDIRHHAGRRVEVAAAAIDVVVTGTAFTVDLPGDHDEPQVAVERGEVEVWRRIPARLLARLHAGEAWPQPVAAPPSPPAPSAADERSEPHAEPAALAPRPEAPANAPSAAAAARRPPALEPRQLLEQANAARRSGDVQEAAALLEALRVRYPRDPRAALATFELGRLRLDALGDPQGAVTALKQSIALAPTGVFREDAEACLANAYARMRDRAHCAQARQDYLGHYPEGTHRAEVAALVCRAP